MEMMLINPDFLSCLSKTNSQPLLSMKKSKVADTISLSEFEGHSTNISQAMLHLNVLLKFLTTSPALPEAFRGTDTTKHGRCEVFRICMTNGNRGLDHNVFHINTCMLLHWH